MAKGKRSGGGGLLTKSNAIKVALAGAIILWAGNKLKDAAAKGDKSAIDYKIADTLGFVPHTA